MFVFLAVCVVGTVVNRDEFSGRAIVGVGKPVGKVQFHQERRNFVIGSSVFCAKLRTLVL